MALNGLIIAAVEMVLVHKLEGRRPYLQHISVGVLLIGVSYAMLAFHGMNFHALALASSVVVTLGEMLSMPFMNSYWIRRTVPANRGQYAGLYTMAWSMAQVVGPFTSGQVAEHSGYDVLWLGTGAICLLLAVAYLVMYRLTQKK